MLCLFEGVAISAADGYGRIAGKPAATLLHLGPGLAMASPICTTLAVRLVNKYNLFVLEMLKAWTDPRQRDPKTIHHRGYGRFVVDGPSIRLRSRMR